jgi:hypothetical protein
MRIAILTLPLYTNYGGILQCYALQTVLQRMGHDVKVLSRPHVGRSYYIVYPLMVCKQIFKRYILGKKVYIFKAEHEIIRKNIIRFINQEIHQYECRIWNDKIANKFDVMIVGSDQVWRPQYSQPIEYAFLSFLGDTKIKRFSYAASFGVNSCEYTLDQRRTCSLLLKKFCAVSVREFSAINICRNYFGVEAEQVLDPTLLLSVDDYKSLIRKENTETSKGNMLVYILDRTKEKINLAEKIARDKGLQLLWLDSPDEQNEDSGLKEHVKISVEQWLRSFDDAEFVLTDSFHGCVFSIIFKKQFIVLGNRERGLDRFDSLLTLLSLRNRLICSLDEYESKVLVLDEQIDYKKVDCKLAVERVHSLNFLQKNLANNK